VDYAVHVAGLAINPDAKRIRRRNARVLTDAHPDLWAWLGRPTTARLADLRRSHAWPLICWAWVNGRLPIDLDLMLAKGHGGLYTVWAAAHHDDVARVAGCADTLGWAPSWARQVSVVGLAVVCLHAGAKTLDELTDDDINSCTAALAAAPSLSQTLRGHNTARVFGLHHACYQLRICHRPPRQARRPAATIEELLTADVPQPEIRQVALRYLALEAATLRPGTLALRADSLIVLRVPRRGAPRGAAAAAADSRPPGRIPELQPPPALAWPSRPGPAGRRVGLQTDGGRPTRIL
jgi:hypothetical protein